MQSKKGDYMNFDNEKYIHVFGARESQAVGIRTLRKAMRI